MRASTKKKAKRMSLDGMSNREIARTLGVKNYVVSAWNRKGGRL